MVPEQGREDPPNSFASERAVDALSTATLSPVSTMAKRILLVDDDPSFLAMLRFLLQGEGYEVDAAYTGEEGLAKISQSPPDLIVLDVAMPGFDGFKVCELVKFREDTRKIPVIFLSSRDLMSDFDKAFSLEAAEYLVKTEDPGKLMARIRKHLQ